MSCTVKEIYKRFEEYTASIFWIFLQRTYGRFLRNLHIILSD